MTIYMACADEEINKRKKEVSELNERLIAAHNNFPFWERYLLRDGLHKRIIDNWQEFEQWMNVRMREEQEKSRDELSLRIEQGIRKR